MPSKYKSLLEVPKGYFQIAKLQFLSDNFLTGIVLTVWGLCWYNYGNCHVFSHKSFQQLSDSPHPYPPPHLPPESQSHHAKTPVATKSGLHPGEAFKVLRHWVGIWNINMLRFWKNIKCANLQPATRFYFCNTAKVETYHISNPNHHVTWRNSLLPKNSPAVFHFYGHLNRITSRIASNRQETQLPWAMVAAAYAPNALGAQNEAVRSIDPLASPDCKWLKDMTLHWFDLRGASGIA